MTSVRLMGEKEKRCSQCRNSKPVRAFWRDANSRDKLRAACIECSRRDKRIRGPAPPRTPEQQARRRELDRARRYRDRKAPQAGDPGVNVSGHALANDPTPEPERWLLVRQCRKCSKLAKMHAMQTTCTRCEPRATEQDTARQKRWEAKQATP